MKILLIDNHSKHLKELVEQLGHEITVLDYKKLNLKDLDSNTGKKDENINGFDAYDTIILSGGNNSIINHETDYAHEIELIKSSTKPILGICLGFELIAKAFDEQLEKLAIKSSGFVNIRMVDDDRIFDELPVFFQAYQSHIYHVKEVVHLKKLAVSATGVEAFKHPSPEKIVYGIQFHPEISQEARVILKNFLKILNTKGTCE